MMSSATDAVRSSLSNAPTILESAVPFVLLAKVIGSVAGSLISLAYILPKGRREAALRMAVGVVTGLIFGTTAGLKAAEALGLLDHLSVFETTLVGSTIASLCAWWAVGVLHRVHERWLLARPLTADLKPAKIPRKNLSERGES